MQGAIETKEEINGNAGDMHNLTVLGEAFEFNFFFFLVSFLGCFQ